MFPEIVRDDIFRLETRRLWLRWPVLSDLHPKDLASQLDAQSPRRLASMWLGEKPVGTPQIETWRSEMEGGSALHLMLVLKGNEHDPIGTVHIIETGAGRCGLRYSLGSASRGTGLMTEAVQSAVDAAFLLGPLTEISASPTVLDPGARRVVERCGFTYLGNGMRENRSGKGLVACDHFRLERKTWKILKGWGLPGWPGSRAADAFLPDVAPAACAPIGAHPG